MARCSNKQITHADIPSRMTEFAKFRYMKHGDAVNVVALDGYSAVLPSQYDIIFSDAVWEHLSPNLQVSYLADLSGCLNVGGWFVFLVDLSGHTAEMPMHFDVDIRTVHNTLRALNLVPLYGEFNFASVWQKQ